MNTQNGYESERPPRVIRNILLSGCIGIIANAISEHLDVDGMCALEMFYESRTCQCLHNEDTGLYLYSDRYIVDEAIREMQGKQ